MNSTIRGSGLSASGMTDDHRAKLALLNEGSGYAAKQYILETLRGYRSRHNATLPEAIDALYAELEDLHTRKSE